MNAKDIAWQDNTGKRENHLDSITSSLDRRPNRIPKDSAVIQYIDTHRIRSCAYVGKEKERNTRGGGVGRGREHDRAADRVRLACPQFFRSGIVPRARSIMHATLRARARARCSRTLRDMLVRRKGEEPIVMAGR